MLLSRPHPSRRKIVVALVTSAVVHLAAAGWAAWAPRSVDERAHFAGQPRVIQLVASISEPQWTPDPQILAAPAPDPPVLIEPQSASIARTRYVHVPDADLPMAPVEMQRESSVSEPLTVQRSNLGEPPVELPDVPPPTFRRVERPVEKPIRTEPVPSVATVQPAQTLGDLPDTPPDLSQNAPPVYPAIAVQRRWQGTVLLRITIDATGHVTQVEVARSSGHSVLDGSAVAAVRRWKAVPASRAGSPASTVELLPVRFKLSD